MEEKKIDIAMVCKLMPYYRLGVFQKLTSLEGRYRFSFLGDEQEQGGIKQIPYTYASAPAGENIRWIKTKNYFYKPERLLWQTGIIKEIFKSRFKAFVFEGAIAHYPIWLFALLCKLRGKKVFYWTHGNRGIDKGIKKILRVIFFKWLGDTLLLYGHTQRDIMIKDGYDPKKMVVIYNSLQPSKQLEFLSKLDQNTLDQTKKELFKNPENLTFIFIGRLVAQKGLMDILQVIAKLKKEEINVNFIVIGKGAEKEKMHTYCQEVDIAEQVHFAGAIYEEHKLAPYFGIADLMVSPGNVGLNCIHAFAYGVPVITHNDFRFQGPEVEVIKEGETGTFFEHNNFDHMKEKIKEWIGNKTDSNIIKSNCQNVIMQKYSPENQSECIINALNQTL